VAEKGVLLDQKEVRGAEDSRDCWARPSSSARVDIRLFRVTFRRLPIVWRTDSNGFAGMRVLSWQLLGHRTAPTFWASPDGQSLEPCDVQTAPSQLEL
jgi:hypothetical protein